MTEHVSHGFFHGKLGFASTHVGAHPTRMQDQRDDTAILQVEAQGLADGIERRVYS